jgi:hypothetical protein
MNTTTLAAVESNAVYVKLAVMPLAIIIAFVPLLLLLLGKTICLFDPLMF